MDKNKQIIDKKQGSWFWLCMRIEGGNNVRLRFCGSLDISWESVSRRFFLCECESLFFFLDLSVGPTGLSGCLTAWRIDCIVTV